MPAGPGFYQGGNDRQTAKATVCIQASERRAPILSNDGRDEAGLAELILSEAGVPYEWTYADYAGKS